MFYTQALQICLILYGSNLWFTFRLLASAIDLFGSGIADTFYPSNALDPYMKNKDVSILSLIYEVKIAALSILLISIV